MATRKSVLSAPAFLNAVNINETPGAPTILSFDQVDNKIANARVRAPSENADGSELNDLSQIGLIVVETQDGVDPTEGMTADEAAQLPGAQVYSEDNDTPGSTTDFMTISIKPETQYVARAYAEDSDTAE